jgi:GNAT superfamily N-acetyltransferase
MGEQKYVSFAQHDTPTGFTITAVAGDWPRIPLIYEADGYDGAAQLMRNGAAAELVEFANGDRVLYLADADGATIGTVGLVFRGTAAGLADGVTSANINRLHVVQSWRKRGIATSLMAAAEDEARLRGVRRLTISGDDTRWPALYSSHCTTAAATRQRRDGGAAQETARRPAASAAPASPIAPTRPLRFASAFCGHAAPDSSPAINRRIGAASMLGDCACHSSY